MNSKTTDNSDCSPRFRIIHLCMLHLNPCLLDHESPKIFTSKKSKNERFRFLSHNSPRKDTRDTSTNFRVLEGSYFIHCACMQEKSAPMEGKIELNLKIVKYFTFFFLKTLRKTPPNCKIMYLTHNPFKNSLFMDSNRLGLVLDGSRKRKK